MRPQLARPNPNVTDPDPPPAESDAVAAGYDTLAEQSSALSRAASPWGDSHFQRHYSWPATRAVMPAVENRTVLLAGCGRGDHVGWFLSRGASVTGVDVSDAALEQARDRFGAEATFYRADLTEGLGPAAAGRFDLVVSHLVLSHISDWATPLTAFRRVLSPDGHLVVATIHPQYLRDSLDIDTYHEPRTVPNEWGPADVPTVYRPMDAALSAFLEAGFRFERIEEPRPPDAYETDAPARYEAAMSTPALLVVEATPRSE